MRGAWRRSGVQTEYGVIRSVRRMALCLPVELSSWGLFSGPAALSPWHPGCGWWQSRISLSAADGAWRRSACVWSSVLEGRTAGPGPSGRCRSHYSLRGQRAEHGGVAQSPTRNKCRTFSIQRVISFCKNYSFAPEIIFTVLNNIPEIAN